MFSIGFAKIANSHSNQGFEKQKADNDNTNGSVGPGGMGTPGIERYEPLEAGNKNPTNPKKKLTNVQVAQLFMQKGASASVGLMMDRWEGGGTGADALSGQLKWDTSTPDAHPQDAIEKTKRYNKKKKYIRAGLK